MLFKKAICLAWIAFSPLYLSGQVRESAAGGRETGLSGLTRSDKQLVEITHSYISPAAFIGFGLISLDNKFFKQVDRNLQAEIHEDYPKFSTRADDYMQYIPAAAVYGLPALGLKGKNDFVDKSAMLLISNTLMRSGVSFLKRKTHRLRPNSFDNRSFPSGHTAQAFLSAEFLAQEYGDVSVWYSVAGYSMASATGTLRMFNNRHWFSDVVAGAGIGILSVKLSYAVYPYLKDKVWKNGTSQTIILPVYRQGVTGITLVKTLK